MAGRKQGQGSKWIRPAKRLAIYHRDGFCCAYCARGVEDGIILTLDHVTACELGGTNEPTNLVTACLSCNSAKQDSTLRQFATWMLDKGIDPTVVGKRIRRQTSRTLDLAAGKALLASRAGS